MIAIVKACGNNFASIQFALERLNKESVVTNDAEVIRSATQVILPGVGYADKAMKRLTELGLCEVIKGLKQPVLGICLGMQLLYENSEEGDVTCLGVIPGKIKKMISNNGQTLPHMGWNTLDDATSDGADYVYFVHSYCAPINKYTTATTMYTEKFTSIVTRKNYVGMQFHPERSGAYGEELLRQFLKMRLI